MRKLLALVGFLTVMTMAVPALAHPLGNYTINHHVGLSASDGSLQVVYVSDLAEIPTVRELATVSDEPPTDEEVSAYARTYCRRSQEALEIRLDDVPADLLMLGATALVRSGEAGLPILRVECEYSLELDRFPVQLSVNQQNHAGRLGWNEVVVDRSIVTDDPVTRVSPSEVLRAYPDGELLDSRSAAFSIRRTGDQSTVQNPDALALVGGGGLPAVIGAALGGESGGGGMWPAMIAALALGAIHALAPGHGKTLMAAYLIGERGRPRHAVGLGLATAVSHTTGVAVLGAVTLAASATFAPERVYPILSAISGLTITGIGLGLLWRVLKSRHGHSHGHPDEHPHSGPHQHPGFHEHHRDHDHHPTGASGDPDVTSSGHTTTRSVGWKMLAALGLAGGLVPSASAVVLLLGAVHFGRAAFGMWLVLLFGLGMSVVLVTSGLAVLYAKGAADRLMSARGFASNALMFARPLAAVVVIVVGTVMSVGAVSGL